MNEDQLKALNHLEEITGYYKHYSDKNSRFYPEYDVVSRIVNLIRSEMKLSEADFEAIVNIYNEIINQEHYNGSAWDDFHFRLARFFWVFGYDANWNTETDELKIKKILPNKS